MTRQLTDSFKSWQSVQTHKLIKLFTLYDAIIFCKLHANLSQLHTFSYTFAIRDNYGGLYI
jgi:hypothetical protein